ncbi:hypothetical protein [Pontiella sulfatireligans]|uniref:hypothetical protein n=1 Tax=Pontiella sulfatireligans TaxID=2750658 RepID=UPI00109D582C|nr:hypothetical protein [Pontiella sulfatireligans]
MKKWILMAALMAGLSAGARADDGILLQRIVSLESRLTELEAKLAPVLEEERVKGVVKQQKALARERMMMDAEIYQRHDLNIIEKLYQTINEDWTSENARKAVDILNERYPRANRTGCALLYLGQMTSGNEQLDHLKAAIERHGGCRYDDGVQVGAYARLYLAMRLKKDGKHEDAAELFEEIRTAFPDAVDHKGQLLTIHLKGME